MYIPYVEVHVAVVESLPKGVLINLKYFNWLKEQKTVILEMINTSCQ